MCVTFGLQFTRNKEWNTEINRLLVKCEKCGVECTVKGYRKFDCLTSHKGIDVCMHRKLCNYVCILYTYSVTLT